MLNKLIILFIKIYQMFISPFLGSRCRFYPSCSSYACEVFKIFPFYKALWYSASRIAKCHPLNNGGYDPIPNIEIERKI